MIVDIPVGDGNIYIQETVDCRFEVAFANRLAAPTVNEVTFGPLIINLNRGGGSIPDDVIILDSQGNITYTMTVADGSTGKTCIPWPVMG